MALVARQETFGERFWLEARELLQAEWQESGLAGQGMALVPQIEVFANMASQNALLYVTLRDSQELVGYFVGHLGTELTTTRKVLHMEALYVIPRCRKTLGGLRLIREVERVAKGMGCRAVRMGFGLLDGMKTRAFGALGYKPVVMFCEKDLG